MKTYANVPRGRVLKSDVAIAKNYLTEKEIKKLERTIAAFFDYIERLIERRTELTMDGFSESVNKFLDFNEFKILDGFGSVSRKDAEAKAHGEYDVFNKTQVIESDFDRMIKKLPDPGDNE